MDMLLVLIKSVFAPLEVINRDNVKGRLKASIVLVSVTAVLGSFIAPAVFFYRNNNRYEISLDVGSMFIGLIVSILTWLAASTMFWLLSKCFGKGVGFGRIASVWGLSYVPNLLCIVFYNLLVIIPGMYDGSGFAAFIISSFFIMLLVWKAIYYFILMRFVFNTTLREIAIFITVSAAVFAALMIIGFKAGLEVPML